MRYLFLLAALAICRSGQAAEPLWHDVGVVVGDQFGRGAERLGLLLPARLNGIDCTVQLDTGLNGELVWNVQVQGAASGPPVAVSVEIGGVSKALSAYADNVRALGRPSCGSGPIALVGNAFFEHGTLILDLGKERFAFAPAAALAHDPAAQPLFYAKWGGGGGHLLVEVEQASGKLGYALLDTGAARFGLAATTAEQWRSLSGGAALRKSASVATYEVKRLNGGASTCYETAVATRLKVGGKQVPQMLASYCAEHPFTSPVELVGVLGLLPLGQRRITIDYVSGRWLLGD